MRVMSDFNLKLGSLQDLFARNEGVCPSSSIWWLEKLRDIQKDYEEVSLK